MNPIKWFLAMPGNPAIYIDDRRRVAQYWVDQGRDLETILGLTSSAIARDIMDVCDGRVDRSVAERGAREIICFLLDMSALADSQPDQQAIDTFIAENELGDVPLGALSHMHRWNESDDATKLTTGTHPRTGQPCNPVLFGLAVKKRLGIAT